MSTVTTMRRVLVGVGNAGVSVLDRIAVASPGLKGLMVINNDAESLAASVVPTRIDFSNEAGEDLADGFLAIEEEYARAISGATSVILCGGLGGETGSFLLPALAARAKADGITTLASVGIPFSFEGRQKRELATTALEKLRALCDAVAVIDNDRLSGGVPSTAAIGEAFQEADKALQSSVLAIQGMLSTSGPVKITRTDLAAVLGSQGAITHFGHGRAAGDNRLHEALEASFRSPLLTIPGKGSALREASMVLLLLEGPSDLSFAEVQRAVSEMERMTGDRCQIKVGVHASAAPGAPLDISIIASSGTLRQPAVKKAGESLASAASTQPSPREPAAAPIPGEVKEVRHSKPVKQNPVKQTQGVLDLENYQRGRFDKSEPTIVNGDDLDIPTFLRKGIKLGTPRDTEKN